MSFLDSQVDLTGTIFSPADLQLARTYLTELLEWQDQGWLIKPGGYLAHEWLSDDLASVCALIEFARLFNQLELGGVTSESRPVLFKKLEQLLRKTRLKKAFEETLTELQVASWFAERAGPILLEPRILEVKANSRPYLVPVAGQKVIDMALPLAGQILFVEVTVLNFEALDDWTLAAQHLTDLFHKTLWLEELPRQVKLTLPFPIPAELSSERIIRQLLAVVATQPEGGTVITLSNGQTVGLEWLSYNDENTAVATLEKMAYNFGQAGLIGFAQGQVSCLVAPADLAEFDERLLKSLRNSLKTKKEQCQPDLAPWLVIRPGNPLLPTERLLKVIEKRLWSNSRYHWLSGLAIFLPRTSFTKTAPKPTLWVRNNPQARFPLKATALAKLQDLAR